MSVCITTYTLASGLIDTGMSWSQALLTIFLGNTIVLIPMLLNAHAGARYGIPFPVFARASFGVMGANLPALLRALVACGWFGIQTWLGGAAIYQLAKLMWPGIAAMPDVTSSWLGTSTGEFLAFLVFWALNVWFIIKGTESIKWLESLAAPFLIVVGLALLWWAYRRAGGFGPILSQPSKFHTQGEFLKVFFPALTAMIGYWATLSLNIPDFTRYARSQKDQIVGQALGLPTTMTLFAFIGVAVTSASAVIFGEAIWDPVKLLSKIESPIAILLSLFALLIATLTTNVAANVVAPANGFANLWPAKINFARGGILTGIVGVAIMPWKLLENADRYIGWLITYSGLLGPIAGIFIADYWIVRRAKLALPELYRKDGIYGRVNYRAIGALVAGVTAALVGLVVPALRVLYDYAWFAGFGVAFVVHCALMRGTPELDLSDVPPVEA